MKGLIRGFRRAGMVILMGIVCGFGAGARACDLQDAKPAGKPAAIFAGGCFWCLESEFRHMEHGILFTRVGYIGGTVENPTYEQVSTGTTGHAEAVELTYNPEEITYEQLVEHFLTRAHDPTEVNRQWVDVGTQYRSAIFYLNEEQKQAAEAVIKRLTEEKRFKNPIATQVLPAGTFWLAEEHHQTYYEKYAKKNGQPHIREVMKEQRKLLQKKEAASSQ